MSKLDRAQIADMLERKAKGASNRELAAHFGCSPSTIHSELKKALADVAVEADEPATTELVSEATVELVSEVPSAALDAGVELRCGRYQDVMQDVTCDMFCTDAPYAERVHTAHNVATEDRLDRAGALLPYAHWTPADVADCVAFWAPRTRGWMVLITDHVLATSWADEMSAAGRYVFAPMPYVEIGSRVRLLGDGPSSWTSWIIVSRPRSTRFMKWGALPGAYVMPGSLPEFERKKHMVGGKPLWLLRQLVNHYSRPGERVADCCAGAATSLIAARELGRSAIGCEESADAYALGLARISQPFTRPILPESAFALSQRPLIEERPADV